MGVYYFKKGLSVFICEIDLRIVDKYEQLKEVSGGSMLPS